MMTPFLANNSPRGDGTPTLVTATVKILSISHLTCKSNSPHFTIRNLPCFEIHRFSFNIR